MIDKNQLFCLTYIEKTCQYHLPKILMNVNKENKIKQHL